MKFKIFLSIATLFITSQAVAHQVWIEHEAGKGKIYFGEYGDNLKETVPGLLAKMPLPKVNARTGDASRELKVTKVKNSFEFDSKLSSTDAVTAQVTDYPVWEEKEEGKVVKTKWIPAARLISQAGEVSQQNTLDILPTNKANIFKLVFRDKPLASTKLALVSPNGWMKEFWSDDKGEVSVSPLWKGVYLLEVQYKEVVAGEINGEKFDATSFTSTATFVNKTGPETKRPAPAKPNTES